jgi:flagellar biosynthesis protein FlhG
MPGNKTFSLSVLSGKGGVGKSNLALNLAFALNRKQSRVLVMDCDLGLANLDVLLGLTPQKNIQNLLDSETRAEDLIIHLNGGPDVLPANSGVLSGMNEDSSLAFMLADKLDACARNYDFIILDVGAGISPVVLSFAAMTLMRLMVITPEPTSLTDSYALIKVLASERGVKDHFVLANQAASAKEAEHSFKRLHAACSHFLNISPDFLGGIRNDPKVADAVRRQESVINAFPETKFTQDIMRTAEKLLKIRLAAMPDIGDRAPLSSLSRQKSV